MILIFLFGYFLTKVIDFSFWRARCKSSEMSEKKSNISFGSVLIYCTKCDTFGIIFHWLKKLEEKWHKNYWSFPFCFLLTKLIEISSASVSKRKRKRVYLIMIKKKPQCHKSVAFSNRIKVMWFQEVRRRRDAAWGIRGWEQFINC